MRKIIDCLRSTFVRSPLLGCIAIFFLANAPRGIADFPKAEDRIRQQINMLTQESLEESLKRLRDVDMYFWPGSSGGSSVQVYVFPLPRAFADRDVNAILSNRRVRKVFSQLSELPKSDAANLVSKELTTAIAEYQRLFDDYVKKNKDYFRSGAQVQAGPAFIIGNVRDNKPTLLGARFRVLALVFLAGNLELEELGPSVLQVAQIAQKQYVRWSQEKDYLIYFNFDLLRQAGIYSRHALGVGLLGTSGDTQQKKTLLGKYKKRISRQQLTHFDAAVTRYDLHYGWVAGDQVDQVGPNPNELTLWTVSPLSDDELKEIVEERRKALPDKS